MMQQQADEADVCGALVVGDGHAPRDAGIEYFAVRAQEGARCGEEADAAKARNVERVQKVG